MRMLIVSTLALSLAACGQGGSDNASGGTESSSNAVSRLTLDASGVPKFRPGEWKVVTTGDGEPRTERQCIGDEANADMRAMMTRDFPKECKIDRSSSSDRVHLSASCPQGNMTGETEMTITGSDTAFDMTLGIYVTMPDGKKNGGEMKSTGSWVGACPAGVKPGEEIGAAE